MEFIYDFWVEMCPFFSGYEFIYVYFTTLTLYILLYVVIIIPGRIITGGLRNIWND